MKTLIYSICGAFALLTMVTFFMGNTAFKGLVVENYFERATNYFKYKEQEDKVGLRVTYPDRLIKEQNKIEIGIFARNTPVSGAKVRMRIMGLAKGGGDLSLNLKESPGGKYSANLQEIARGKSFCTLYIEMGELSASRSWMMEVE